MKDNKEKIEFWLHSNYKNALKAISEETGYSVSELMRRGVEHIIRGLMPDYFSNHSSKLPFSKQGDQDVK